MTGAAKLSERKRIRMSADARREVIIDAAQLLFSQRPYSQVSMMNIAEASGITRANLNYHFGSKRDIYVEVIRNFARLPPLPPTDRKRRSLEVDVERIISHWLDTVWESRGNFLTLRESGPIHSDFEIEAILEEGRDAWNARLAELLELPGGATRPARGLLHGFGAMSEAAVDDWLRRERLGRADVQLLLTETLLTIARKVAPVVLDLRPRKAASAVDD